jgi:nicotinate-nucleotide adenylyltransferase
MTSSGRLGILGGTFDPIHLGHLAVARAAAEALRLAQVTFIPSRHPPHRRSEPHVSSYHRFGMVALSISDEPRFAVSDIELRRDQPSYTATTLRSLAGQGLEPSQIFFILGADAFAEIDTWKEYPTVLDLSNFIVVSRPGVPVRSMEDLLPDLVGRMRAAAVDGEAQAASDGSTLGIYLADALTPEISSTEIRARLGGGLAVAGLVTPVVERYIERHALYAAAGTRPMPGESGIGKHGRSIA